MKKKKKGNDTFRYNVFYGKPENEAEFVKKRKEYKKRGGKKK